MSEIASATGEIGHKIPLPIQTTRADSTVQSSLPDDTSDPKQILTAIAKPPETAGSEQNIVETSLKSSDESIEAVLTSEKVKKSEKGDDYFKVEKQVFLREAPIYTEEKVIDKPLTTNKLIAFQSSGVVADEHSPLYSDRIANCFALILKNEKSGEAGLFHIDANFPTGINMELLNQISEGGGLVVMQAVRGSQSIPSEETKRMFSEHILANILIAPDVQIKTGSDFWDITYFPDKGEFYVHGAETNDTFRYIKQVKQFSEPELTSLTNEDKLVLSIGDDSNVRSYLGYPNAHSPEEIVELINTLATFVSKESSRWVDRWTLSSKEEKQVMASQIVQNLNVK